MIFNRALLYLSLTLAVLTAQVVLADEQPLPDWAKIESGWSAEAISPKRVLLKFKTDRALMLVEEQAQSFDSSVLAGFFQGAQKSKTISDRRDMIKQFTTNTPTVETSVKKEKETVVATITSQFTAAENDVLIAEQYWISGNKLWHVVFIERSLLSVSPDSYRNAIELIKQRLLTSQSGTVQFRHHLSPIELLFSQVQEAQSLESLPSSNTSQRKSAVGPEAPQCQDTGFDPRFVRDDSPEIDLSLADLNKGCQEDLKKVIPFIQSSVVSTIDDLYGVPQVTDTPKCHHLKPRENDIPGPGFLLWQIPAKQREAIVKWAECTRENQIAETGKGEVNLFSDPETYRRAFRETLKLTEVGLAYLLIPQTPVVAMSAVTKYSLQKINNIGCLKTAAQNEAVCRYAANAAAVTGAAICTAVSRGRCAEILSKKLLGLAEDAVAPFKEKVDSKLVTISDEARLVRAERFSLQRAKALEKKGVAEITTNFDCTKINKYYPGSFADRPKGCVAIKAKEDIQGEFCSCGKIEKRSGFNFLFHCPTTTSQFHTVSKYSDGFTLPHGTALDYCARVTIPKGKECYSGSTAKVFDETLAGNGGQVQLFCFNGISDRVVKKGATPENLQAEGFGSAHPERHVQPVRWSPFSNFTPLQSVVQSAAKLCPETCSTSAYRQIKVEYESALRALESSSGRSAEETTRLAQEKNIFEKMNSTCK